MNRIEHLIGGIGRFVFGLGIGLALTSAYVIVAGGPDVLGAKPDVVRLDPVVVTITADRFAKERLEAGEAANAAEGGQAGAAPQAVHAYGRGPQQV